MPRECALTGSRRSSGHNVSHSNRKTARRFLPNLQRVTMQSEALGRAVSLRVTTRALRSVLRHGGLDAYLLAIAEDKLGEEGRRLQRRVRKAVAGRPRSS